MAYWKKGTSRRALVIPALGVCLKFARIRLWSALAETNGWFWMKDGPSVRHALKLWSYPIDDWGGARGMVFRGIRDNWREWRFSVRNPHPVVARTYLTLGFLNVQEAAKPGSVSFDTHMRRFQNVVGWRALNDAGDPHAFTPNNFGVRDGKACVVDYASPAMQKILAEYGDKIHADLDLVSPS